MKCRYNIISSLNIYIAFSRRWSQIERNKCAIELNRTLCQRAKQMPEELAEESGNRGMQYLHYCIITIGVL